MKKAPRTKKWRRKAAEDRARLFAANPHCHWCGTITIVGKGDGDRLATLEHIRGFHACDRDVRVWDAPENKVIACFKCNNSRSSTQLPGLS